MTQRITGTFFHARMAAIRPTGTQPNPGGTAALAPTQKFFVKNALANEPPSFLSSPISTKFIFTIVTKKPARCISKSMKSDFYI
jgi:hypothetical protein